MLKLFKGDIISFPIWEKTIIGHKLSAKVYKQYSNGSVDLAIIWKDGEGQIENWSINNFKDVIILKRNNINKCNLPEFL